MWIIGGGVYYIYLISGLILNFLFLIFFKFLNFFELILFLKKILKFFFSFFFIIFFIYVYNLWAKNLCFFVFCSKKILRFFFWFLPLFFFWPSLPPLPETLPSRVFRFPLSFLSPPGPYIYNHFYTIKFKSPVRPPPDIYIPRPAPGGI